jgi:hypothetical protein
VYPRQTNTLGNQLSSDGRTWRAYLEDIGNGGASQPTSCRHPLLGGADGDQAPRPADAYVTWRNPFVYFHSVVDSPVCTSNDVGLDRLPPDLKIASKAPSFAYIVPNRCHDGSQGPCTPGAPGGLAAAEAFLQTVVPEIESSPAYKDAGLIAITFDQAPQSGANADSSGCCITSPFPNVAATAPATTTPPGTSTAPAPAITPAASPPAATTAPVGSSGAAPGAQTATPSGGGRVGLLLISKYVKPGSVNATDEYNHFSLLRSVEDLFGLGPLGYAGTPGLLAFDRSVFNAYP